MRSKLFPIKIRLLALFLIFSITASATFAFQSRNPRQARQPITLKTALKAIDFASKTDISCDSEFTSNLRMSINLNRNRYYQPKYGRFTSRDPIGFSGDSNLYRYANDNPVMFTDPFGNTKQLSQKLMSYSDT